MKGRLSSAVKYIDMSKNIYRFNIDELIYLINRPGFHLVEFNAISTWITKKKSLFLKVAIFRFFLLKNVKHNFISGTVWYW